MKFFVIFLISILLMSCTSMSEKQCITNNWYQQGVKDAHAGLVKSKFGSYKEACLRHGISFDKNQYIEGYESVEKSK